MEEDFDLDNDPPDLTVDDFSVEFFSDDEDTFEMSEGSDSDIIFANESATSSSEDSLYGVLDSEDTHAEFMDDDDIEDVVIFEDGDEDGDSLSISSQSDNGMLDFTDQSEDFDYSEWEEVLDEQEL